MLLGLATISWDWPGKQILFSKQEYGSTEKAKHYEGLAGEPLGNDDTCSMSRTMASATMFLCDRCTKWPPRENTSIRGYPTDVSPSITDRNQLIKISVGWLHTYVVYPHRWSPIHPHTAWACHNHNLHLNHPYSLTFMSRHWLFTLLS